MAGTIDAFLEHTMTSRDIFKVSINGQAIARQGTLKPLKRDLPVRIQAIFQRVDLADQAAKQPYIKRLDGRTIEAVFGRHCDVWGWR